MIEINQTFIDVDFLAAIIDRSNLIVLDCSTSSKVSSSNNELGVIPGARFFDLKNVFRNCGSEFPNTIPSQETFQEGCRNLGINNDSLIVVYDNVGIYSSPRVWWLFKIMGHKNVVILNGGLVEWKIKGNLVYDTYTDKVPKGNFTVSYDVNRYRSFEQIKKNLETQNELIIDVRSAGRFRGEELEPREEIISGNIPNSINIPFKEVLKDHLIKSDEALINVFSELKTKKTLIFSCGSGTTACIVLAAANNVLSNNNLALYDGSWTEWVLKNGIVN
jgi:thiosulfate/3-mercaptopyruvate sulfurtransferase